MIDSIEEVVLLVDQHTLDSYLALCALDPVRAVLIYDRQMAGPYRQLASHLEERLSVSVVGVMVEDDSSLDELDGKLATLDGREHLHYTGGSGSLSAHARMVFEERWPSSVSSCLDEDRRMLHFDDGTTLRLRDLIRNDEVTLADIAGIQGYDIVNVQRPARNATGGERDAELLACEILREPLAEDEQLRVAELRRAAAGSASIRRFLRGGWLEIFTASMVRSVAPDYELSVGVRLKRDRPTFELDVVAVGRFHPYIISCSTSHDGHEAKRKLFEVKERTRRLAGAVGRPALVTLADQRSRPSPQRLRQDLADLWDSVTTPMIFDRTAVTEWLQFRRAGNERPSVGTLRDWLVR
ncbi:MAG TPA: DUF1887 family CARF protein [Solirubrobacteraceae bacterium]|jgi:hypothetical protein|nr:DUF1887 family CARF protein [Solirubrobacteraceae bacterium]